MVGIVGGVSAGTIYAILTLKSTLDQDTKKANVNLKKLGGALAGVTVVAGTAAVAMSAAIAKATISAGSDVEEMQGKFDAVFRENADDVEKWANQFGDAVGRSRFELMGYAATLEDTFVPLGFARDEGAELSKQMTELAIDLASFNNEAEPETIAALQSALVGNHETMRRYGVIITQTTLNQELLNMGIVGGMKAATEQQKVQARLNIIMQGTTDAQGDAARTAGSFANQTRRLKSRMSEMMGEAGRDELPELTAVLEDFDAWGQAGGYENIQGFFSDVAGAATTAASAVAELTKQVVFIYSFYADKIEESQDKFNKQQAEFARGMLASGRELDDQQRAILEVQAAYGLSGNSARDAAMSFMDTSNSFGTAADSIVDDAESVGDAIDGMDIPGWAGQTEYIKAELERTGARNIGELQEVYTGGETGVAPTPTVYTGAPTAAVGTTAEGGQSSVSLLMSIDAGITESNRLSEGIITAVQNIKITSGRSSGGFGGTSSGTGASEVSTFLKYQTIVDKVGGNIVGGF